MIRWTAGWSNQFGFPWEVGMYWKFKIGEGESQRPIGCPGIDEDFGTISDPKWPFLVSPDIPIRASHAMQCEKNEETASIVDALADDNEYFAEKFLEGWQQMISNGYSDGELVDGPENAWVGYHSLEQQGIVIEDFDAFISANAPLVFTDPKVCVRLGSSCKPGLAWLASRAFFARLANTKLDLQAKPKKLAFARLGLACYEAWLEKASRNQARFS